MKFEKLIPSLILGIGVELLAACASQPASTPGSPAPAPATSPSAPAAAAKNEAEAADLIEKRFQEAARSYKLVEKDGKTLYCKREKVLGSTIPTMQCLTESQLRLQVEQMEDLRQRMRSNGRCTLGPGCSGS